MKIRNYMLLNYNQVLSECANWKLPQKISYAITKNLILVGKELEIYNAALGKLFDSYSDYYVKDENGNVVHMENGLPQVDDDHSADLNDDIQELLNTEIDFDAYHISDEAFDYEDSDRYDPLSAADMLRLRQVLCDE